MSREIVHICVLEKFIPPFIEIVRNNFCLDRHLFIVSGKSKDYLLPDHVNVIYTNTIIGRLATLGYLYKSKKIILHGLYDAKFLYLLALQPWLLKKSHWAIWGDDLYQYLEKKTRLKRKFKEMVRSFVIRRIGFLVGFVEADCDLARKWYGCVAPTILCLMYESNTHQNLPTLQRPMDGHLNIQLGNSAYPRNNHIDMLEKLEHFKASDVRIYAPLSYGPTRIAEEVSRRGKLIFGEKFVPVMDFMPFDEFQKFLANIDIAIFNNTTQQAMGNIVSLIGMGKTVFIRRSTTMWGFFESLGIVVLDAEFFSLTLIDSAARDRNIEIIKEYFSKENFLKQLSVLFSFETEN